MDRRVIWAIALMMLIALAPTFFMKPAKKPAGRPAARPDTVSVTAPAPAPGAAPAAPLPVGPQSTTAPAETLTVSSPLYTYSISSRGGMITQATPKSYRSLYHLEKGEPVRLLPDSGGINTLALLVGRDTLKLSDWTFTPSAKTLSVTRRDSLVLTATQGQVAVRLVYRFHPDDYQIEVAGTVTGLGPVGGTLLIGMGHGMRQTEADTNANLYDYGVVTKTDESKLLKFSSLDHGEVRTINGPFEWAAVKSKYFVTAILAIDSAAAKITGATVHAAGGTGRVHQAEVTFGVPVEAKGDFQYRIYAGPMEYPRLRAIGHDFYDINPYGWPGFRTLIRPIAVGARWLLVWMHQHLNLAYGVVLVLFGVMIRVLLWPLNQRGMRASMRMQAIQPEMQRLQEQYKNDPQKLQAEVMGLYKREGVNPFSGCWPMLLPWPVLLALFFVLANTIELRGQSFLWLPDLSLKDPLFILPVLMGASMFGLNKIGMAGMPPNPQTKMMLYFLPIMMTVMFLNFASGLNLYYFVQNLASIPQQWLLAKERRKAQAQPVVGTKKAEGKKK
ncbi:MAG TPA: membrane protein insertase YidC [Gemmatimonadales bacterium]|nr:membrane protein insertase YidC [Gemmatimonadales bacterium]